MSKLMKSITTFSVALTVLTAILFCCTGLIREGMVPCVKEGCIRAGKGREV